MEKKEALMEICLNGSPLEKRELFAFSAKNTKIEVLNKFRLWARTMYPQAFQVKSASFHIDIEQVLVESYLDGKNICIIGFRGCAKTVIAKLFMAFVQQNDMDKMKKYVKVISKDLKNPKQFVTDVYNMHIDARAVYGNLFLAEDDKKRAETRDHFVLKDMRYFGGVTVGSSQRGSNADFYRPDFLIFDDIEDRGSVSSGIITEGIIQGIDEAITGLAHNGNWIALCNYISEAGAVEWLKQRCDEFIIIPIETEEGKPTWIEAYNAEKIKALRRDTYDFFGEYLCQPQRGENKFFPAEKIEEDMKKCKDAKELLGVRYFEGYKPNHRYGIGSDHSEGIGKDSNAFVVFDHTTGEIVATYANNQIHPDLHAHECMRVGEEYGNCVWAMETNNRCGGIVLSTAVQKSYPRIWKMRKGGMITGKSGWETTKQSKTEMLMDFRRAYLDDEIKIYDKNILREMLSYTNTDLGDIDLSGMGMLTRHFDLLMSACIAYQTIGYYDSYELHEKEKRNSVKIPSLIAVDSKKGKKHN